MLLDEIAARLTSTGVALGMLPGSTSTHAFTIYKSLMPDKPDKAVALFETTGIAPFARFNLTRPSFQVRVRGARMNDSATAYTVARLEIDDIKTALHGLTPMTLSSVSYAGIWAEQEPFPLGYDANERPEFVCNFTALRDST